ncbi:MAG: glycosyltransferase family 1 protein [Phycisphaerae bacterium]|jgi:glycosyltransferase involved in cell wall biosynthesis
MILFDARWIGSHGIGRFAEEVIKRLPNVLPIQGKLPPLHPLNPFYISWLIKKTNPSVFYTPGFNPPLYSSVPFVFTIHDLNHIQFVSNPGVFKRTYYDLILKPACHRAFKVVTVSEFSRRSIIEWSNVSEDRVVNVGNGVSKEYCPDGKRYTPGYPYIFWVGNYKPHKNLSRLLDAFLCSGVKKDVKLLLAGELDASSTALVKEKKLANDVVFAGLISEEKMPSYYRGAEAFVFPSLYEGFGLPVLEAMACGTPVITSNCTALPEVAGTACMLINSENTDAIAEAINEIVRNLSLRKSLRAQGIKQAGRFSWNQTAAKIQKILEQASHHKRKCYKE